MFDINVVLDIVASREPFRGSSEQAYLTAIERGDVPYLSAHAYSTLYYLLGASATKPQRDAAMSWIFESFSVAGVNAKELETARGYAMEDFEDAIVVAAAESSKCERIVSRNVQHFQASAILAVTPRQYLEV